jgi:hypothetical protein
MLATLAVPIAGPAPAVAADLDFQGGPEAGSVATVIPNDHTPFAVRFNGSGLDPDSTYYVKVRFTLTPTPSGGGANNRGFVWNKTTGKWVVNRGAQWGEYPTIETDADGKVKSGGDANWMFAKFGNENNSGTYYLNISLNKAGDEGATRNSDAPLQVTVVDMKTEGAWLHNGIATGAQDFKRVTLNSVDATSSTDKVLTIHRTEKNDIDDDSNGIVDDEDWGPAGATGDWRLVSSAEETVAVYMQQAHKGDFKMKSADEDIAFGSEDTTAPAAPTDLAVHVDATTASLSWDAATDDVGVTAYHVYRWEDVSNVEFTAPHVRIATVSETSFEDSGLTPGATYNYEVRAADAATNVSARSGAVSAPIPLTHTLTYLAGSGGSIVGEATQTVPDGGDGEQVTAVPDANHRFVAWSDGFDEAARTDINVTEDLTVTATFAPTWGVEIQHDAAGVTFDRFVSGHNTAYSGGGYVYGRWTGTKLQARFSGERVRWVGPKQPNYGKADVYIDGVKRQTVDCYEPKASATLSTELFKAEGLKDGPHTLEIRLVGQKNPASTSTIVVIDRFEVGGINAGGGGVRIDEAKGTLAGPWIKGNNSTYYAKAYHYSRYTNASFKATFTGTKVAWIGPKTGAYGRARVYIDGVQQGTTVSQRGTMGWRERVWESKKLTPGTHTIEIRPTATKDPQSRGLNVVIDALDVTP